MDGSSFDQADLARLSDKDKAELQQFITNETQRTRLQAQTHALTEICWKKCMTGGIKGSKLDKSEESCFANCVDRFLDVNMLTLKNLNAWRSK